MYLNETDTNTYAQIAKQIQGAHYFDVYNVNLTPVRSVKTQLTSLMTRDSHVTHLKSYLCKSIQVDH